MSEITSVEKPKQPIFTLSLYAYHLRTDISKGPDNTWKEAEKLWEDLVELGNILHISALQDLKQELICYQQGKYNTDAENPLKVNEQNLLRSSKDGTLYFKFRLTEYKDELKGSLSPWLLHDTYFIDLTLFCNSLEQLVQLLNLRGLLLLKSIKASIGQTLFIYAEIPDYSHKELQIIADDCVVKLFGNQTPPSLTGQCKLLGNPIFEYKTRETEPSKQHHILVWLRNHKTCKNTYQVSKKLMYFFCNYHKILYAYNNSKSRFEKAEKLYSTLETNIEDFEKIAISNDRSKQLKDFKELLLQLPTKAIEYSKLLRNLADDENTIATNIQNYESLFNELRKLQDNDLSFLQDFIDVTKNLYIAQIQVYHRHLEPGTRLFQQLIDTIRDMVAIYQAEQEDKAQKTKKELEEAAQEREKRLELVITLVGTGFAVSSVSAAVMPNPSKFVNQNCTANFLFDMIFHILIGSIFASLIGLIAWNKIINKTKLASNNTEKVTHDN
ncbi:MAG: hypothetical protein RMZ41_001465 [Nostoc sp. DedVER02]|uniref:hypothetical protein n=1 Tax=unclassified Nostoc TaxID=2593658 RepID=UPI002AD48178|nr:MULTISPECIES: hypothetical protein [unclassified Nostoc]MDZ7987170.1 hypothetical protein [Nostoc sp. DedVER02]MDZ8110959.1 hypothetical protein [Nostoc sp. DedVER01b]